MLVLLTIYLELGYLTRFMIQTALAPAEEVIEQAERLELTRRDSVRPLELLDNPPCAECPPAGVRVPVAGLSQTKVETGSSTETGQQDARREKRFRSRAGLNGAVPSAERNWPSSGCKV